MDIVMVPGFVSHLELAWEMPFTRDAIDHVTSFARLIRFDKRGTGLSDRVTSVPTLEQRMDDLRAVMDAAGSEQAALWGTSEGGAMCILFAATYPERTSALVLVSSFARLLRGPDQPWGYDPVEAGAIAQMFVDQWGTGQVLGAFFPSTHDDARMTELFARYERNSARPGDVEAIIEMCAEIDVRPVLPTITVPSLVVHHAGDPMVDVENGRYLANHIPAARYIELDDADHVTISEDGPDASADIREFLTGTRTDPDLDRVLATVLFTDIVASTERVADVGDSNWKRLLDRHDELMRREIERFRGREVKSTGDGFLAVFDGPARAAQCALAASDSLHKVGLDIRAGVHTGEIEQRGDDVGGIAVHIGARIAGRARGGEVLASRVVRDLVAGSPLQFSERGEHELKGVPGSWELYSVAM